VHIPYHQDQIARHGLHRRVIAVQAVQADIGQFNRAFDDGREYRSLWEASVSQAEPMLGLGIDVIIPAGGYPMLLFTREPSFAMGGATVLNGLPVAVAAAETAVGLTRLNGTGTSRRTAYAPPPGEAVTEFRSAFTVGPPQYESTPTRCAREPGRSVPVTNIGPPSKQRAHPGSRPGHRARRRPGNAADQA